MTHPRTAALTDPGLPELAVLLSTNPPAPLEVAVEALDGSVASSRVGQVSWSPGRSVTVRFDVEVAGGPLEGRQTFIAAAGRIPDGALIIEDDGGARIGVWRFPHDPALPALPSAIDPGEAERVLVDLGGTPGPVTTHLRAYRPGRRAVVEVRGAAERMFFKVVRPKTIERLHQIHRTLADVLPVPASLGYDDRLGLVVLQAMDGITLREAMARPEVDLPDPGVVAGLVSDLPHPEGLEPAHSPLERAQQMMPMVAALCPELTARLAKLSEGIGEETLPADRPVHGDYYESQLMVVNGHIVGILDVDTYGLGRAADDPSTMLAHLSVWGPISPQPERVRNYGNALLSIWDRLVDPADLRRRAAAMAFMLATGPFRVQTPNWPEEIAARVAIAELWAESARRVDERTLMPFSE